MMHSSLSRGHSSGISVILSGRGFLKSVLGPGSAGPGPGPRNHEAGPAHAHAGDPVPVKLQLLASKQGSYSIRVIQNDDRHRRSQPLINEEITEFSVVNHTNQEFEFILNQDGSQHCMSFSNLKEGQHFLSIFTALHMQEPSKMSSKRGVAASMAARFSGMTRLTGGGKGGSRGGDGGGGGAGGGGGGVKHKSDIKIEANQIPTSNPMRGGGVDVFAMVDELKTSIQAGDEGNAAVWAKNLANQQPRLSVMVETSGAPPPKEERIQVQVQVEDRISSKLKLRMTVPPNITIAGLKKLTCLTYDLPIEVQNWIVGGRIAKERETLEGNGITSSGATLYLYLTTAEKVNIRKEDAELKRHMLAEERKRPKQRGPREDPQYQNHRRRTVADRVIPPSSAESYQTSGSMTLPGAGARQRPSVDPVLTLNSSSIPSLRSSSLGRPARAPPQPPSQLPSRPVQKGLPSALEVGWGCPKCTLVNPPLIPGCQACMAERPESYIVPRVSSYVKDPSENMYVTGLEQNDKAFEEMERHEQMQNYQDLIRIDEEGLVPNREPFDCAICFMDVEPNEGVVLRECLHTFCRDCLKEHVKQTSDALVMCPNMEGDIPCKEHILEREIKALLSDDEFAKYLERGLQRAETSAANSFHCKTTDCKGFCFYEDNNNFFECPLCKRLNCLTCKAIHEGVDCKQYQEDLRIRALNDTAARQTKETLDALVEKGEAMHCPRCNIIVQKKGGCDWLRCSVCQIEICWVMKKARWGPGGTGDISGGCRCRVNGQKCHPQCHNCH